MKAVVRRQYGSPDVLKLEEVAVPTPADDEALIKIRAASVNRSDWEALTGKPLYARIGGLFKPGQPIIGSDIAGEVVAVGKDHAQFKIGDEIFGEMAGYSAGFAEYACSRGKYMALKPAKLSFEEAAAIPQAAVIALQGIRDAGQVKPGQQVLINGAGGGTGMYAIQLAKSYGAEVTAVDNEHKLNFMRSIGADNVIDYKRQDFTKNKIQYDFILDVIAYRSVFAYARSLKPNGRYYAVGGSVGTFFQILFFATLIRKMSDKQLHLLMVRRNRKDLQEAADMCASGKLITMIDKRYPLSETPAALRYLGDGYAKGKIVIQVQKDNAANIA